MLNNANYTKRLYSNNIRELIKYLDLLPRERCSELCGIRHAANHKFTRLQIYHLCNKSLYTKIKYFVVNQLGVRREIYVLLITYRSAFLRFMYVHNETVI